MSLDFLLVSFVVVASPGTGALYTIATGLSQGTRASIVAAFGCTLGIIPHLVAAVSGLAALLHASALAFQSIKYAGVVYLFYMAWQTLKEHGALRIDPDSVVSSSRRTIARAVLINLLNPKLSIFFFAFLPQFTSQDDPWPVVRMLELSGVFMAMTFVVFALYGVFAAAMRERVISRPTVMVWLRRTFAGAFVLLGAKLATAER